MKADEFYEIVDTVYKACMGIMKSKGEAYSGEEDKFGNFKRVAKKRNVSPFLVWGIYFDKHLLISQRSI